LSFPGNTWAGSYVGSGRSRLSLNELWKRSLGGLPLRPNFLWLRQG
jgi:hypothetical protein